MTRGLRLVLDLAALRRKLSPLAEAARRWPMQPQLRVSQNFRTRTKLEPNIHGHKKIRTVQVTQSSV